jgi:hypothetical protein
VSGRTGETAKGRLWWGEAPERPHALREELGDLGEVDEIGPNNAPSRGPDDASFKQEESDYFRRLSKESHLRKWPALGPARRRLGVAKINRRQKAPFLREEHQAVREPRPTKVALSPIRRFASSPFYGDTFAIAARRRAVRLARNSSSFCCCSEFSSGANPARVWSKASLFSCTVFCRTARSLSIAS